MVAFAFLVNTSRASPLSKHSDHQEAKELHFNRTMAAKAKLLNKAETSINKTLTKLAEVKETLSKVTGKVKAKVMEALNKEVQKWASIGDKIQEKKAAFFNILKEKLASAKEKMGRNLKTSTQHKPSTKSTTSQKMIPAISTTSPARGIIESS